MAAMRCARPFSPATGFFSIASGQPQTLLNALAEDFEHYKNVEVISGFLLGEHLLAKKDMESSFHCKGRIPPAAGPHDSERMPFRLGFETFEIRTQSLEGGGSGWGIIFFSLKLEVKR